MRTCLVIIGLLIFIVGGNAWGQIRQLPRPIQPSSSIPTDQSTVEVPEVRGWTEEQAKQRLQKVGLIFTVEKRSSNQPKGTVIDQEPKPGDRVDPHSQIRLFVVGP
jgi:hypothetical protein